ncbi:hypothetical protein CkaCkLH20_00559 [Colletotrichum karsti]|uniref:Uncharacterized protein n=1 Tax=Colletotrichum karsti TaxID=1095194 RepID=A0A9P6LPQ8_9PEZI|nr:uncharacterized protein CkaCkLH20_00559 [Colletotrichum karsti]KAF9881413.1 hypothetical protein CkaCkLH20_00559 [Colletotrichum karsti]
MLPTNILSAASVGLLSTLATCASATPTHKDGGPIPPDSQLLFSLKMNLGASVNFGLGPRGTRFGDPILGGSFEGPKLNGVILPVGGDWGLLDARGGFQALTVFQFQTADGANIFVRGTGPTPNGKGLHYLSLETGAENYYWVNDIMVVGATSVDREKGLVTIDAWQMIPPAS